jgi:hypothetical protein
LAIDPKNHRRADLDVNIGRTTLNGDRKYAIKNFHAPAIYMLGRSFASGIPGSKTPLRTLAQTQITGTCFAGKQSIFHRSNARPAKHVLPLPRLIRFRIFFDIFQLWPMVLPGSISRMNIRFKSKKNSALHAR